MLYKFISFAMVLAIAFTVYHRSLALTLSPAASGVFAGFAFLTALPLVMTVIAALHKGYWSGAAFLLLMPVAMITCSYVGYVIAKWAGEEPFHGAIWGGFAALFCVLGPLAMVMIP